MAPFVVRKGALPVEVQMRALLDAGHSRTDATLRMIERLTDEARHATAVVLVEGLSDQIAVEVLAQRQGHDLRADGTFVVPTGGASNFGRFLSEFGPHGRDARLLGLYDSPVEHRIRHGLERAGLLPRDSDGPLADNGFFGCVDDLEDEMIRALGPEAVERVVAAEGQLRSFRRLQGMPFHRDRPLAAQLHRFVGNRKYRYAPSLAMALDLDHLPAPLAGLFGRL